MSTRQIHVFISHAWAHSQHYDTLASWIFEKRWSVGQASLDFRNYSVPINNPIHDASNMRELQDAIFAQIARSHVVVIPSGMYASHRKWIQKEINGAREYGKPILAVIPWGQQRNSEVVLSNAEGTVGWNKEPLISEIWRLYKDANAK